MLNEVGVGALVVTIDVVTLVRVYIALVVVISWEQISNLRDQSGQGPVLTLSVIVVVVEKSTVVEEKLVAVIVGVIVVVPSTYERSASLE